MGLHTRFKSCGDSHSETTLHFFLFVHGIIHLFNAVRKISAIITRRLERHQSILYHVQEQLPRSVLNTSRELLLSALKLPPLNTHDKYKLLLLFCNIFSSCGLPWALWVRVNKFKRLSQLNSIRNKIEPNLFDLLTVLKVNSF